MINSINSITFLHLAIFILTLNGATFALKVAWRCKNGLDLCHKYYLAAISAFALKELLKVFEELNLFPYDQYLIILDTLLIIFLILGLAKTERIIKKLNGEIK